MKTYTWFSVLLCTFVSLQILNAQECTFFNNDPLPLTLNPDCGVPFFNAFPISPASAYQLSNLNIGTTYAISLCNSVIGIPAEQMDLVILDPNNNNIIAQNSDCVIEFSVPVNGNYLFVFNEIGNCGEPTPVEPGFGIDFVEICNCLADRFDISAFILDPVNGLNINPALSNVWLSTEDYGFGPGFEGLVPAGTEISPFMLGLDPYPGETMIVPWDAYFFWIDDEPMSRFQHATRFVLVDPTDCVPSITGGSILVSPQGWWPILTIPDSFPVPIYNGDLTTAEPPGPANSDGLIAGTAPDPGAAVVAPRPPDTSVVMKKAAGIVVAGDNRFDMRGDVPRWRKQLQDRYGLDSTRILGTASDSAITKQGFCDLIDTLCAMSPAPDSIYIRLSTHGSVGSICFADGAMTATQLCDKFKKVAKKGVPIMLFIDACNSSSLFDANNWNFPAGSMIIVAAQSGRSAWGWRASEADNMGNPVPGTEFSGGMLSAAHMQCKNDDTDSNNDGKTDADTNRDGNVDDCEAFNWVVSQKPCFVTNLSSPQMIGPYVINTWRFYPAGPPTAIVPDSTLPDGRIIKDGAVIWPNPMPSYRAVGKFSGSMNFNVQNNTGGAKNTFYMVFCGDVSDGFGGSWKSTANDSITDSWGSGPTSTYDDAKDETTVCWMSSGDAAADQSYIHFGYTSAEGKNLRPKKQYWSNTSEGDLPSVVIPDSDKVPSTQSSILLHGSGTPLTVKTINLGKSAGGWGHPVNYTLGYYASPSEIPLVNLTLGDSLFGLLTYNPVNFGSLDTNDMYEFDLIIPDDLKVGEVLILQVDLDWALNPNITTLLFQWSTLDAAICEDDILFAGGDTIPNQVNSEGVILLDGAVFRSGLTTLNARNGVETVSGSIADLPPGTEVHIYGHGCREEIPAASESVILENDGQLVQEELEANVRRVNEQKRY